MSRENVDALRAMYEEWERGNFGAGVDLLDPDVLFMPRADLPDSGRYLGREGVAEFHRGWLNAWTDLTVAAQEFIEAENSVVVAVHMEAIGPGSGTPTALDYFDVWTFRGRAVIRRQQYRDRAEALEVVGLRE
jgi:ketosteroid isomerase-like protein